MLAAACQLTSGTDRAANLRTALALLDEAADRGARFAALPETWEYFGDAREKIAGAEPLGGPTLEAIRAKAKERALTVLAGSVAEPAPGGKIFNTSVLIGPDGADLAVYRKIHLFDVDIPDGARYRESETVEPGDALAVADTALGRVGLSVCYDLRFPELYRALSARGAEVLCVPSAFTHLTGLAHWEPLLRARAIENLAYVVAAAQVGRHTEKRVTWGHAMIVDPWGTVLAQLPDGPGVAVADVDLERLRRARRELPALSHRRL